MKKKGFGREKDKEIEKELEKRKGKGNVKKCPWKIECFLEDLFLGSQWSIILQAVSHSFIFGIAFTHRKSKENLFNVNAVML